MLKSLADDPNSKVPHRAGLAAGLAVPIAAMPGSDWRWSLGVWALLALGALIVWLPQGRGPQHHLLCGVLLVIGSVGLLLLPHLSWLWMIAAGLGAGIAMVTSLSLFALRTHNHHQAAALSGMAQFIGYVGAAAGPLLIGVLHDLTRAWTAPMLLMVAASLLVTVFAVLAGRARFIE
ncbi:hypothetical protein [Brevundimonas sp.]|jgi:cyanate permease|uniref:hypothetical protein n=1 Tax=Brevundimonas sp. TaxID=1871086 RepID=UPI0037BF4F54